MSKSEADEMIRRTILIVEDDEVLRMVLRLELEKSGFEVREAENGQVGLASIVEALPDVIITDIEMPVMDGFAFISAVRKIGGNAAIPIIAISALRSDGITERAVAAGANQFCQKPFTHQSIVAAIKSQLSANTPPGH